MTQRVAAPTVRVTRPGFQRQLDDYAIEIGRVDMPPLLDQERRAFTS